jgi:hypothetical protein
VADRVFPFADLAPRFDDLLAEQFLNGDLDSIGLPASTVRLSGPDTRIQAAVAELRSGGSVSAAAKRAWLSERQLERLFEIQLAWGRSYSRA